MDLCNLSVIRDILSRYGFNFKKSLGQNFLIESWVPERTAEGSLADRGCGVIEIGPGIGTLTHSLCQRAAKVVSIELDSRLMPVLDETLHDFDNVKVINGDALKLDLASIVDSEFSGLTAVACANLPYYVTTPVLERLFECRRFKYITVMVQREVAHRICAKAGSRQYGAFTVYANYYSEPEILFDVPSGCFIPRPKVDSAVVRFNMRQAPPGGITDSAIFFRVVRAAFSQRRKTLLNCLWQTFGKQLDRDTLSEIIRSCGFAPEVRGERLSLCDFAKLSCAISEKLR